MSPEVSFHLVGLDIDFHHPDSKSIKLTTEVEDAYSVDKEDAAIIIDNATERAYSPREMLDFYLLKSQKQPEDFLPGGADDGAQQRRAIVLPLNFPENRFHMVTDRGVVDIKTLRLAVEISTQSSPKGNA